ncbi:MAG: histidine phosphatase family protein [Mycobacterium sp.]
MSTVVKVALIGHGLPNRVEGVVKTDPGLAGNGFEQDRGVADAMVLLPVRTIASSGLQRTLRTAAPTAEKLGPTVDVDLWLDYSPHDRSRWPVEAADLQRGPPHRVACSGLGGAQ